MKGLLICAWTWTTYAGNYWDCTNDGKLINISYKLKYPWSVNTNFLCFHLCFSPVKVLLNLLQTNFIDEVVTWKNILTTHHTVKFNVKNVILKKNKMITPPPDRPQPFPISMPLRIISIYIPQLIRNVKTPHYIIIIV